MSTNTCVQKNSAMEENAKMKTLANDLTRRMLNTSESMAIEERVKIVDGYAKKLLTSGYGIEQTRRIIINGIKGYAKKLSESRKLGGRKLHRKAAESSGKRSRKKLLDKSEWFKIMKRGKEEQKEQVASGQSNSFKAKLNRKTPQIGREQAPPRTRTVLFVEQTNNGKLAKDIRSVLTRIEHILGFRIKVVERTGTSVRNLLPNTNPWAGSHCSREDCVTCNQGTEVLPDCKKRSLVYENICLECNPGAAKPGDLKEEDTNKDIPSIYVGETARSVMERSKEHWDDFKSRKPDSHILKHWVLHHHSAGTLKFIMKVIKFHRSALSRQVGEAIRIQRRGVDIE